MKELIIRVFFDNGNIFFCGQDIGEALNCNDFEDLFLKYCGERNVKYMPTKRGCMSFLTIEGLTNFLNKINRC